jgi:hypothetical protein
LRRTVTLRIWNLEAILGDAADQCVSDLRAAFVPCSTDLHHVLQMMFELTRISSTWSRGLTRSSTQHTSGIIAEPVYDVLVHNTSHIKMIFDQMR